MAKSRIFIIEDDPINQEILKAILEKQFIVFCASDGEAALNDLKKAPNAVDLILLDLSMPKMDGKTFLKEKYRVTALRDLPVIVTTASKEEEAECLSLGAVDFLSKPYDMAEIILARVDRILRLYKDNQIIHKASHDELTGLYTKEFFDLNAEEALEEKTSFDLMAFRIANYSLLNDLFGEEMLERLARAIGGGLRAQKDSIGMKERDNTYFALLPTALDHRDTLAKVQEEVFRIPCGAKVHLHAAVYPHVKKSEKLSLLRERLNAVLDRIQFSPLTPIVTYDKTTRDHLLYLEKLANDFPNALKTNQFTLEYQPIYQVDGKAFADCAEVLVRWEHPLLGRIKPNHFFPELEKRGLIQRLDSYIFAQSARDLREFQKTHPNMLLALNVTASTLSQAGFAKNFLKTISDNGALPTSFIIEVDESNRNLDLSALGEEIRTLMEHGVRVTLEGFGKGSSNYECLVTLPHNAMKLSADFFLDEERPEACSFAKSLIAFSKERGTIVVMEKIENEAQRALASSFGCSYLQGRYLASSLNSDLLVEKVL